MSGFSILIRSYQDLEVWKRSIAPVKICYSLTSSLPKSEQYSLANQIQRAATSIPANIAEGRARGSRKEFAHFLNIAYGSLAELETHIFICIELGYLKQEDTEQFFTCTSEIGRMLNGLRKSIKEAKLTPETRHLKAVT